MGFPTGKEGDDQGDDGDPLSPFSDQEPLSPASAHSDVEPLSDLEVLASLLESLILGRPSLPWQQYQSADSDRVGSAA